MRFYALTVPDSPEGRAYIEAEVAVPEYMPIEEGRRHVEHMGMYGDVGRILTRDEVLSVPDGMG